MGKNSHELGSQHYNMLLDANDHDPTLSTWRCQVILLSIYVQRRWVAHEDNSGVLKQILTTEAPRWSRDEMSETYEPIIIELAWKVFSYLTLVWVQVKKVQVLGWLRQRSNPELVVFRVIQKLWISTMVVMKKRVSTENNTNLWKNMTRSWSIGWP